MFYHIIIILYYILSCILHRSFIFNKVCEKEERKEINQQLQPVVEEVLRYFIAVKVLIPHCENTLLPVHSELCKV